ncbi:uncharacterized protein LOC126329978 [Schistocerca gregaria]|uniref:uncharacterized protein LOC126329978 n=1 Tax=Schistocerca gregaria TaxID=7010 RepID=UPI00211EFCBC|nr:uncharacterized protein LOC126329978 [Schistocerca gregaria]
MKSEEESKAIEPQPIECHNDSKNVVLPWANVGRLMKISVPIGTKVARPAQECVQSCISEFISFVTGESSDLCMKKKKKVITGDDIIKALKSLGFDNYVQPLQIYLDKYREARKLEKDNSEDEESEESYIDKKDTKDVSLLRPNFVEESYYLNGNCME